MKAQKRMLSIGEAGYYLGVSRMTLITMEERGLIAPARTLGGHRRYTVESLERNSLLRYKVSRAKPILSKSEAEIALPDFIGHLVSPPTSIKSLLDEAVRHLAKLFQVETVAVLMIDGADRLGLAAAYGLPEQASRDMSLRPEQGVSGRALEQGQPLVYRGEECDLYLESEPAQGVCVPLIFQGHALGVIHVVSRRRYQFFPSEIHVLSTVALYLSALIVNLDLLRHYERRAEKLSFLYRISEGTYDNIDTQDALDRLIEDIVQVMRADLGVLFLYDEQEEQLFPKAVYGFPQDRQPARLSMGEGVAGWVVKYNRPYLSPGGGGSLIDEETEDPEHRISSRVCAPVRLGGHVVGVLYTASRTPHRFDDDDLRFLSVVASSAAVAESARTRL